MADFCKECSFRLFGEDHGDFKNITNKDEFAQALCEGCGFIWVNQQGERVYLNDEDNNK